MLKSLLLILRVKYYTAFTPWDAEHIGLTKVAGNAGLCSVWLRWPAHPALSVFAVMINDWSLHWTRPEYSQHKWLSYF